MYHNFENMSKYCNIIDTMEIKNKFDNENDLSIALGFFDGFHKGHRAVINSAVDFACKNNLKSAVVTFRDHPCCFFYNVKPQYILKQQDRIEFFKQLGIDYLYLINFDEDFSKISAEDYLKEYLVNKLHPKAISSGFNHYFGADKKGDTKYLNQMKAKFGYEYFEIEPQMFENTIISSSEIRKALTEGDIELANSMLGYKFFIKDKVIEGQKLARSLGFKTANLNYSTELIQIPNGVYKVEVDFRGQKFNAIANFGVRPTIAENNKKILEVHIFDFDEDIYERNIKINFIKKIRDEKKFNSLDALKAQIQEDIAAC